MKKRIEFFDYLKERRINDENFLYEWLIMYGVSNDFIDDLLSLMLSDEIYKKHEENSVERIFVEDLYDVKKIENIDFEISELIEKYLYILESLNRIQNGNLKTLRIYELYDKINSNTIRGVDVKEIIENFSTCGESLENIEKLSKIIKNLLDLVEENCIIYGENISKSIIPNNDVKLFNELYEFLTMSDVFVNYLMIKYKTYKNKISSYPYLINRTGRTNFIINDDGQLSLEDSCYDRKKNHSFVHIYKKNIKNNNDYKDLTIKLYVRVPKEKISNLMADLAIYSKEKNLSIYYKTRPFESNDMITIRINNVDYLEGLLEFLRNYDGIILENHPFMPTIDGIGITFDQGGSYNRYTCESIKNLLEENENATYLDFEDYLNKSDKEDFEQELFVKNFMLSKNNNMTLANFLSEYKEIVKNIERYKMKEECINKITGEWNFERGHSEIDSYFSSKIDRCKGIEKILEDYKTFVNIDIQNNELLKQWYNIECDSIIDFMTKIYIDAINSGSIKDNRTKAGISYFIESLIEKWIEQGGIEYATKALNSIKCVYEKNVDNPRFKNANAKYGEDINKFLMYTKNLVPYEEFREESKYFIESYVEALAKNNNTKKLSK